MSCSHSFPDFWSQGTFTKKASMYTLHCFSIQMPACVLELPPLESALYFKVLHKNGEALLLEIRYRHSTQVDALPFQA